MTALHFQTIAQVVAGHGLNTLLEGMVLAAVCWAALRCFGTRTSMTRFAVWFATLLGIAALPLLSFAGKGWSISGTHVPEVTLSSDWAGGIFLAWAIIALLLLARLGFSLIHVYRLRRKCEELNLSSCPALAEIPGQSHRRQVRLLVSNDVRIPTALGFFHPAVVIPAWALRDLSSDELKVIVLHELAHLRRWDDWTNLGQKIVKALFFFHPAVWWIDSRLALEREIACDDLVLEQTSSARDYAASLVSIAEKVVGEKKRMARTLALAQGALGRMRQVSARIARILDGQPRSSRGWRPAMAIVGMLAVATFVAMPYAPELVSFQGSVQPVLSAQSNQLGSVAVIPASMKWSGTGFQATVRGGLHINRHTAIRSIKRQDVRRPKAADSPLVIPAKATVHPGSRAPKVTMAKAVQQRQPAATLLVFRSTRVDEFGNPMWTLSVWRMTGPNGQTVQEMIMMNSI